MTFQSPGSLRLVLIKLFFRNVPVMEREKICFQNESKSLRVQAQCKQCKQRGLKNENVQLTYNDFCFTAQCSKFQLGGQLIGFFSCLTAFHAGATWDVCTKR